MKEKKNNIIYTIVIGLHSIFPSTTFRTTYSMFFQFKFYSRPIGTPSSSESSVTSQDIFSMSSYANSSTMDSSINYQKSREGRAKWGSYLFDTFSKDNNNNNNNGRSSRNTNGPVWLEKSLSEARDSEEETMSISVHSVSSFLRGQNVPVDPFILAEREAKRRKAMELQHAIKEQLEERENIKKLEREIQWQQEKLEEERLARQMDVERQRLEKEQKIQNEKLENERKKEEIMRKALEKAALEAQLERERKRREKALALQNSLDETISIQRIGEKTEIYIDGCQKSPTPLNETSNTPVKSENNETPKYSHDEKARKYSDDEDDGEAILIGTPIKLKKKNLENFKKKFYKRQQNLIDDDKISEDENCMSKANINLSDSDKSSVKSVGKQISDLEGIAIVLQAMPLVPFVPFTNDMFNINQLNNLALLMAAQQNRLNSPNVMLPIIPTRDISTPITNEKLDLSQFIIPPNNSSTITLQIQQVDSKQTSGTANSEDDKIMKSVPPTPENAQQTNYDERNIIENSKGCEYEVTKVIESTLEMQQVSHEVTRAQSEVTSNSNTTPIIPHDGTFTKEDCSAHQQDAYTSTITENQYSDNNKVGNEIKILTPKKYRNHAKVNENSKSVSTQTESFLFCEYCSYQHHHRCSHLSTDDNNNNATANNNSQPETTFKPKDKKSEDRPKWGVRNPPIKYLKASERDPFYGRNRKKRYLRKAASESEKNDDSCTYKDCPLIKSPLLPKRCGNNKLQNHENICSNLLPIKTDRFGRVCLVDEQNFIMNEAMRRAHKTVDFYASDTTESSLYDIKHKKSFFLPKSNDFQDIFVD